MTKKLIKKEKKNFSLKQIKKTIRDKVIPLRIEKINFIIY